MLMLETSAIPNMTTRPHGFALEQWLHQCDASVQVHNEKEKEAKITQMHTLSHPWALISILVAI